jgi:hypothetical protein
MPGAVGMLIGAGSALAYFPLLAAAANSQRQQSIDNAVLFTQQLDELFNIVEQRLGEEGAETESYRDLMHVYRAYDGQFVALNNNNPDTQLAKAYAAKRMGHCTFALGELETARGHYRQAAMLFESLWRESDGILGLYSQWIRAQIQLVVIGMEEANLPAACRDYLGTLQIIEATKIAPNLESSRWLVPRYQALAVLGAELKLYSEAKVFAERFAVGAKMLANRYPSDAGSSADVDNANELLEKLTKIVELGKK